MSRSRRRSRHEPEATTAQLLALAFACIVLGSMFATAAMWIAQH